jgi:hypothetical protein
MTNWLTGWDYRKSHLITASAGAGTLYQTMIKVYKTTGTDGTEVINGITAGKVYVGSNCRDDFGDIRFTDNDGDTLLDYWMDPSSLVSGTSAIFWVEVADTLESNATIYIYYKHDDATDVSNGDNTFLFFDDFLTGSLDGAKWVQFLAGGGSAPTVAGTACTLTVHPAVSADSSGIQSVPTFTKGISIIVRRKHTNNPTGLIWYCGFTLGSGVGISYDGSTSYPHSWTMKSSYYWWFYTTAASVSTGLHRMPASGGWVVLHNNDTAPAIVYNTYQQHEYRYDVNGVLYWFINGTEFDDLVTDTNWLNDAKKILINAGSYSSGNYGSSQAIDYVLVRKFIATEPAHSTWGTEEASGPTTYTLTYSVDALFQKLGLTASYSIDAKIAELDITKPYSIDVLLKKLGIEKSYDVDVLVEKLGITETYSIDAIFEKLGVEKPYTVDVLFKLFGITKTYNIDVLIRLITGIEETYDIDTILKKLGVTKTYSIDSVFKKLDVDETYGIDVLIRKLGLEESYVVDVLLKKLGITKTYSVDTLIKRLPERPYSIDVVIVPYFELQTYPIDVRIISGEKVKGRMNIVKSALMTLIKAADSSITTIDEADLKTWDINFPMASVKLNPSSESKMSFGNKLPDGTRGQYFVYNFSIHVFTEPNTTDQLKAKDVMELAETIKKYLRRHNKDSASGILDIYDITYRESDPEPHGTRKMTRAIMTGKILVERPWGTGFDN